MQGIFSTPSSHHLLQVFKEVSENIKFTTVYTFLLNYLFIFLSISLYIMVLPMDNSQGRRQFFQDYPCSQQLVFSSDLKEKDKSFVIMEGEIYDANNSRNESTSSSSTSIGEDSSALNGSLTSLDTEDDASSASANSSGSLCDLTDLVPQLPIKKGLSKFYQGKSQSYTSLSRVKSIEDLPKKESPYNNKRKLMKSSKSYAGGLNNYKSLTLPKPVISKNISRGYGSSSFTDLKKSYLSNCNHAPVDYNTKEQMI
ncbi:hypothetical protein AG4045_003271 [Apium graveolens]|uniref:Uncharacterized protein n=2 Tax=Apium graveolens TaxID=4045 RepID=A0A6L5B998_APIGR|nr:hypothetical protein AG4045_003271 [Apium graveolens]